MYYLVLESRNIINEVPNRDITVPRVKVNFIPIQLQNFTILYLIKIEQIYTIKGISAT